MRQALARDLVAALLVAIVIDRGGTITSGVLGGLVAIVAVVAPSRALDLLRAELRSLRIRTAVGFGRGIPVGPVLAYAATVLSVPFLACGAQRRRDGSLGATRRLAKGARAEWLAIADMLHALLQ